MEYESTTKNLSKKNSHALGCKGAGLGDLEDIKHEKRQDPEDIDGSQRWAKPPPPPPPPKKEHMTKPQAFQMKR